MSKSAIDRREFAGKLAAAGAALALPAVPAVAARREPKLVIDRIEWSADQLEFHSGAFPPDTLYGIELQRPSPARELPPRAAGMGCVHPR